MIGLIWPRDLGSLLWVVEQARHTHTPVQLVCYCFEIKDTFFRIVLSLLYPENNDRKAGLI